MTKRVRRKWQNPFYLKQWNNFWDYVIIDSLMSLYDKSPSLILYSADLTTAEKDDVDASLTEIKEGQTKKFGSVEEFLKELKE